MDFLLFILFVFCFRIFAVLSGACYITSLICLILSKKIDKLRVIGIILPIIGTAFAFPAAVNYGQYALNINIIMGALVLIDAVMIVLFIAAARKKSGSAENTGAEAE